MYYKTHHFIALYFMSVSDRLPTLCGSKMNKGGSGVLSAWMSYCPGQYTNSAAASEPSDYQHVSGPRLTQLKKAAEGFIAP